MVVFHGAQTGRHAGEYFNEISIYVPYAGCMRQFFATSDASHIALH